MPPTAHIHAPISPEPMGERPESSEVDAALLAWRRKAADIALAVVAAANLPVLVLGILGARPEMGDLLKVLGVVDYLLLAGAALLRPIGFRVRLLMSFFALYAALAVVDIVFPNGPYAYAGVITLPLFALVLLGARAGRIALLASMVIILSVPVLRVQPAVIHALEIDPTLVVDSTGLIWFRATVKTATLVGLMFLLERFHGFLVDALTQRIIAQRKSEYEMRKRQRLEREIATVGDEERRHLGQELHDGVCQQVTAALLRCQALERRLERGGALSGSDFVPISSLLAETVDEAHNVARGLCPLEPDPDALVPALRMLTRRIQEIANVRSEFLAAGDLSVADPQVAQHLYRIAQEALSNAVRHANAGRITVRMRGEDGELTLQVEDDGQGLPAALPTGGMGVRTMAYRAQVIGGEFSVAPAAGGGGTCVTCRVPIRNRAVSAQRSAV